MSKCDHNISGSEIEEILKPLTQIFQRLVESCWYNAVVILLLIVMMIDDSDCSWSWSMC